MEKIDFGDVNKFLVSIGLFLISLSIAFPYFYLKEDFGLTIESSVIEKYSPELQEFIKTKQNYAINIQSIIPVLYENLWVSKIQLAAQEVYHIDEVIDISESSGSFFG